MSDPLDDRPPDSPCLGAAVTDEEIMAYADGVLADERLPAVREELANNPERMKTLEAYLKTKEAMAHALGPILVATVPERLRDTIHELAAAPAPARGLGALLRSAVGGHLFAKLRVPMLAVAALCLVFLGAWLGDYAMRHANPQPERQELVRWEPRGLVARAGAAACARCDAERGGGQALRSRFDQARCHASHQRRESWCREFDLLTAAGRADARSPAATTTALGSSRCPGAPTKGVWRGRRVGTASLRRSIWARRYSKAPSRVLSGTVVDRDKRWISSRRRWRETP